jgi:thiol-disulfide isomerase/thioredoxin
MPEPDSQQPPAAGFAGTSAAERSTQAPERRSPRLWPWLLLMACVAALFAIRMFAPQGEERPGNGRLHPAVGTPLTQISLQPLTGGGPPITASDLAGKVTLINFWATWCGPCRMEFPHLIELEEDFRSRSDFQFLSVSTGDQDGPEALKQATEQFLRQERATFRTLSDRDYQAQRALAFAAGLGRIDYPTTVLIDRSGVIRGLWIGYAPGDERRVRAAIEAALRGEPLPAAAADR